MTSGSSLFGVFIQFPVGKKERETFLAYRSMEVTLRDGFVVGLLEIMLVEKPCRVYVQFLFTVHYGHMVWLFSMNKEGSDGRLPYGRGRRFISGETVLVAIFAARAIGLCFARGS